MTISLNCAKPMPRLGADCGDSLPFNRRRFAPLFATLLLAIPIVSFAARPAAAALISDNDYQSPADPTESLTPNPSLLSSGELASNSVPVVSNTFEATLNSAVYEGALSNPFVNGTYGSNPDALTFVYQITNTDSDAGHTSDIELFDVSSFGSALADVGYVSSDWIAPSYVERDPPTSSDTIGFGFDTSLSVDNGDPFTSSAIQSGETSALLIINTNASTFSWVRGSLQDGSNISASTYAITVSVPGLIMAPEPGSILLMLMGLAGLFAVARARRRSPLV